MILALIAKEENSSPESELRFRGLGMGTLRVLPYPWGQKTPAALTSELKAAGSKQGNRRRRVLLDTRLSSPRDAWCRKRQRKTGIRYPTLSRLYTSEVPAACSIKPHQQQHLKETLANSPKLFSKHCLGAFCNLGSVILSVISFLPTSYFTRKQARPYFCLFTDGKLRLTRA